MQVLTFKHQNDMRHPVISFNSFSFGMPDKLQHSRIVDQFLPQPLQAQQWHLHLKRIPKTCQTWTRPWGSEIGAVHFLLIEFSDSIILFFESWPNQPVESQAVPLDAINNSIPNEKQWQIVCEIWRNKPFYTASSWLNLKRWQHMTTISNIHSSKVFKLFLSARVWMAPLALRETSIPGIQNRFLAAKSRIHIISHLIETFCVFAFQISI